MRRQRHIVWAAIALLGIAAPAALTWSITQVTGQRIGLTAQPLTVVRGLAPARREDQGGIDVFLVHRSRAGGAAHRRAHRRPAPASSPDPAGGVTTTGASLPPAPPATVTGTAPVQAAPTPLQTPAAVPGTRSQTSGGHAGDDSRGGGSGGGPDD